MGSNSKTLEVITVEAYPNEEGGYKGRFILPLICDVNITNELTNRMKSTGPNNELLKYDEFTFIELSNNKYKARDLWLIGQETQNHFVYEKDGAEVVGADTTNVSCAIP